MILSPRATQMFSAAARAGVAVVLAAGVFAAQPPLSTGHAAAVRIKDITDFEGIRENMLVGYGLVVGLNGTGDSLNNSPFTRQSSRRCSNGSGSIPATAISTPIMSRR